MGSTYPSPNALATTAVSNSSIQIAPVNPQRVGLFVFNASSTVTIWVCPTGTTAVAGGLGCVAVQPLQGNMFGPPNTPPFTNAMNAIASSGGTNNIAVWEYYT